MEDSVDPIDRRVKILEEKVKYMKDCLEKVQDQLSELSKNSQEGLNRIVSNVD